MNQPKPKRVSVELTEDEYNAIQALAAKSKAGTGKAMSTHMFLQTVVRDAIRRGDVYATQTTTIKAK